MLEVLELISEGKGTLEHIVFLKELSETIKDTALCGLGNTAPNPILTTLKYFEDEYVSHISQKICPSHVCTPLVKFEVNTKTCIRCGQCKTACPVDAIVWEKKQIAKIDIDRCIKCKSCITTCPVMAIE